ncbi:DUF1800 domain-containing protein [candidate division KSB1 bacterium]|nr:DUF1800 domain-containing protein [candidate division KSB1 bacterium]
MINNWTWEKARHLLFRAGFGGKREEIETALRKGLPGAIDELLSGPTRARPEPQWLEEDKKIDPREIRRMGEEERKLLQKRNNQHTRELQGGWLQFMIAAPTPADMLHEKMVFFWHSHFATSAQKVKATPFLYNQLKLFHQHALGNFGDLLRAIIRDPAMLRYLDNDQNRKGQPNENLARELMELFSLGPGNYTEQDIREGARALTGYSLESYQFRYRPFQHDAGSKTILGRTGNFSGDDFVEIILEQPACAEFMARKLWVYFAGADSPSTVLSNKLGASENPQEEVIKTLAGKFREAKYDVKKLLCEIFSHPEFYSVEVMGTQIKSPIQLVAGTARTLELAVSNAEFYSRMLFTMGQVPYLPPNVKGWPGGSAWIDTSRLVTRYTFGEIIAEGKIPEEMDPRSQGDVDLRDPNTTAEERRLKLQQRRMMPPRNLRVDFDAEKFVGSASSPAEIIEAITRVLLAVIPSADERKVLIANLEKALAQKSREEALQRAVGDVMLLPAYQLC